jgi:hypothetical protein
MLILMMDQTSELYGEMLFVFLYFFLFSESITSGLRSPINEDNDINNSIKSERIVLSSKIDADCPFFI